jgi:hypothetical protein
LPERFFWSFATIDSLVSYPGKTDGLVQRQTAARGEAASAAFFIWIAILAFPGNTRADIPGLTA